MLIHDEIAHVDNLAPLESIMGEQCRIQRINKSIFKKSLLYKDEFCIHKVDSNTIYAIYHYYSCPLANYFMYGTFHSITHIIGKYNNEIYEHYFKCPFTHKAIAGPYNGELIDEDGNTLATIEMNSWKRVKTLHSINIRNICTIHISDRHYSINLTEYRNTVGFFDLSSMPRMDLEVIDQEGKIQMWLGIFKPKGEIKVIQNSSDLQILSSIFLAHANDVLYSDSKFNLPRSFG